MRNVIDKKCRENKNTHSLLNNYFFSFWKIVLFMKYEGVSKSSETGPID